MIRSVNHNFKKKKYFLLSKGYLGRRKNVFRILKQSIIKSFQYSYIDRKIKKRFYKSFWISSLNFFLKFYNLNYSKFISYIKKKIKDINIKVLYDIFLIDKNKLIKLIYN